MMSIYIIAGIVVALALLVVYAFLTHTLEKRRVQRQRLLAALKARERTFHHMVKGLPPHFLSADLTGLVYRALIETYEQLAKLEPAEPEHRTNATLFTSQLSTLKQSGEKQRVRLESPTQIKEVRQQLQELFRFVKQQESRNLINAVQAAAYTDQLKRLALQLSVDGYTIQAKQAQQQGKWRLAVHHLTLARKALIAENANHSYDKQIGQLHTAIQKLEVKSAEKAGNSHTEVPAGESQDQGSAGHDHVATSKEWEHYSDEQWKKKQVYD